MIQSMTMEERENPSLLTGPRRARIAKGSGCTPQDVNALIKQFEMARKMMKGVMQFQDMAKDGRINPDGTLKGSITGGNVSSSEREKRLSRKQFEKKMRQKQAKKARQKKK
jgi:signal recognition particle GTPase